MIGQAERLYDLNNLISSNERSEKGCKIISITSGKGGTGKSFIAGNISSYLANEGLKVLLIDLDINLANQNVLFNVSTKETIYHYLTYNRNLAEIVYNYSENLDLIFGESGKLDHPKLYVDKVNTLFNELWKLAINYDFIIIDTTSGIDKYVLQVLLKSDDVIVVTTPEPTAVMDSYAIIKLLKNNHATLESSIIINKCLDKNDGKDTFENLEQATKHFLKSRVNLLGEINFSVDVIRSIQDQKILINSNFSSQISDQIKSISNKLRIPTNG